MRNNFVFVCLTPYHLFITYSYIRELKNYEKLKCTIIFVQGKNNFKIDKEINEVDQVIDEIIIIPELFTNPIKRYWKRLYYGGRLFKISKLSRVVNDCTTLLIFNDTEPISWKLMKEIKKKNKESKIVLIDEGTGLYNFLSSKKDSNIDIIKSVFTRLVGNEIKYRPIGMSKEIDVIVAKEPNQIPSIKSKGKKIVKQTIEVLYNERTVEEFMIAFIKENFDFYNVQNDIKTVLFIDQPISEYINPVNSIANEEKFMIELFSNISRDINIIIKPHPRDDFSKYKNILKHFSNVSVVKGKLALAPIECLLAIFRNTTILTYNSSAGINAKYINPKIRVCFIYPVFYKFLKELGYKVNDLSNENIKQQMGESCKVAYRINEIVEFINTGIKLKENYRFNNKETDFYGEDIEYFRNLL